MTARPFRIEVDEAQLDDLRRRLELTRWPQTLPDAGWDYGTDADWLRELCTYWHDEFDWATQVDTLNALPQVQVRIGDLDVHAVHARGVGPDPMPLVLTHGWPSSFYEMHKVIGPLADPGAFGGDPADAFHVVVPSIPGYGFSSQPTTRGFNTRAVSGLWVELMDALGYDRFGAHGGDWGSAITSGLAAEHAEHMIGIHLSLISVPVDEATLPDQYRAWYQRLQAYQSRERGYVEIQRTKPQTASFGLSDSPAGLAAWVLEKWWRWSDVEDDHGVRDVYRRYTRDELLTTAMIYWVTNTIGPSMRLYYETFSALAAGGVGSPITVPTGYAGFNEPHRPPRALAEPHYDLRRWAEFDQGGHFPAMENPDAIVTELRAFFRPLRS